MVSNKTEPGKAREWRKGHGLSVLELARLTGYSVHSIYKFEEGNPRPDWAWQRYKLACAAVDVRLKTGQDFRW